jgi:site-specific DNA recombinase
MRSGYWLALRQSRVSNSGRRLLTVMLDAVYFDIKQTRSIVAVKPKPPFRTIFQVAASREGSDIRIINEPLEGTSVSLVETGSRHELYLKRRFAG